MNWRSGSDLRDSLVQDVFETRETTIKWISRSNRALGGLEFKRQFDYTKVHFRGLFKNTAQMVTNL